MQIAYFQPAVLPIWYLLWLVLITIPMEQLIDFSLFLISGSIYIYTRWNNVLSTAICMKIGVKQNGVLCPILFCVYFEKLLKRIESPGMGCYIGHF